MIIGNRPVYARIYRASADKEVICIEFIVPRCKRKHSAAVVYTHTYQKDSEDKYNECYDLTQEKIEQEKAIIKAAAEKGIACLQSLQAEANTKIAQAKAEERRAMAVALEQEMRAEVVKAESEVPKAMAEALRTGNIGVLDYYKLQNIQADTKMKKDIGNGVTGYVEIKKDKE